MDLESRRQHVDHLARDLVEQATQAGRDEMARTLADWIADLDESDQYVDGAEDALLTLIHHGANDPR